MSNDKISYDDSNLQQLFAEMDVKQRMKALKGGFRKAANDFKKAAINNLRQGIHSSKDLESGVRALVFKQKSGFRVTVGTKRGSKTSGKVYGIHTNRKGLQKPVLIWAENGTKSRKTKGKSGHSTGRMRRYGFIAKTRDEMSATLENNLKDDLRNSIFKVAQKYGCKCK